MYKYKFSNEEVHPQDKGNRFYKNSGTNHIPKDSNYVKKKMRVTGLWNKFK
jgi:hypothetical protein